MQDITNDVLDKAVSGDMKSFELIYKAASHFVYNVAFRIVGRQQDAEEVTQEVFMTVHRKLSGFRRESSFKTWIYRITTNYAINYSKKRAKELGRRGEYDENSHPFIVENDVQKNAVQEEHQVSIDGLLKLLNPDQRACIVLRNMEGLNYQQIADVLKININTVRSRLKRARETLLLRGKEVINNEM